MLSNEDMLDYIESEVVLPAISRAMQRVLYKTYISASKDLDSVYTVVASAENFEQPMLPFDEYADEYSDELISVGQVSGWWGAEVSTEVVAAVNVAMNDAYRNIRAQGLITESSLDRTADYLSRVRDRLVRGLEPPLPDDAFDTVRVVTQKGISFGWSRQRTAERLAQALGWDNDRKYWQEQKAAADAAIDAILDPIGPPGNEAREFARFNDPRVQALRDDRNEAIKAMDSTESYWKKRATRIARTESTGAMGYASLSALKDEGISYKRWQSAHDPRTRDSHIYADGQVVGIDEQFIVGGWGLLTPGDPSAPAEEVINCRCTIVGYEGDRDDEE